MSMFERFLIAVARLFPDRNGTGEANTRREFLGSALRVGVGVATLQFLGIARPEGLYAALGCSGPGCLSCGPGTVLPDEECEDCKDDPPDPNYTYCSCCKTDAEEPQCCWSVRE